MSWGGLNPFYASISGRNIPEGEIFAIATNIMNETPIAGTALEIAQNLIRIPSVNPDYDSASAAEAGMAAWIALWARAHNLTCEVVDVFAGRPNVVITLRNGADHPHLLLNGHTDTVGVSSMTIVPFGGDIIDGCLRGRGAADMKSPLACMMEALLRLRKTPESWKGTVTFAAVVDEECGFAGIRHFLERRKEFDFAVVGEPTQLRVIRGCKGCLRFFIRARGLSAHSSTPEKGRSAIVAMARATLELQRFFSENLASIRHSDFHCSTGSIGLIRGGQGVNIVPDFCQIEVDVRLVPGQDWRETYLNIQECVLASSSPSDGIEWEFSPDPMVDPPFVMGAAHPLVRAAELLSRMSSDVVAYSCDASKIANAGIPCIVAGPGDIARAHTCDESIPLASLEDGVTFYVQLARILLPTNS